MRSIEKLIGEAVSSVIILIIGFIIVSELANISPVIQRFVTLLKILLVFLIIAIGIKVFDYIRK